MASGVLVLRDPAVLQRTIVSSLVPNALASLPIGYWQRRVGARAFALQMVPAQPRHAQTVTVGRLPGGPPITVLRTAVMTWGWVPWIWDGDLRLAMSEARTAMRRVLAASTTACASVVFIVHARWPAAQVLPRLRLTPPTSDSTAVGLVTIDELSDLFEEAALDLDAGRGALPAQDAARSLRLLQARTPTTTVEAPTPLIS